MKIRVALINDEVLKLKDLSKIMKDIDCIKMIGKYMNPEEAFQAVAHMKPDIVFLDTAIADESGIRFGKQVKLIAPNTKLVFVTKDRISAVDAFELNALDYIIEPVDSNRIIKTINRYLQKVNPV